MKTLVELKEAAGMTRSEMAEYFNIPYRTIQNWELEIRQIPPYLLELMEYKLRRENII